MVGLKKHLTKQENQQKDKNVIAASNNVKPIYLNGEEGNKTNKIHMHG